MIQALHSNISTLVRPGDPSRADGETAEGLELHPMKLGRTQRAYAQQGLAAALIQLACSSPAGGARGVDAAAVGRTLGGTAGSGPHGPGDGARGPIKPVTT